MAKNNSPASLQAKISKHFERLAKATDQAAAGQAVQDYLKTCAKFHQYSPFNQFLILFERPDDPLSQPAQGQDPLSLGRGDRRVHRPEDERAPEARAHERLADDARRELLDVDHDVR